MYHNSSPVISPASQTRHAGVNIHALTRLNRKHAINKMYSLLRQTQTSRLA
jgi:hypothetical protein